MGIPKGFEKLMGIPKGFEKSYFHPEGGWEYRGYIVLPIFWDSFYSEVPKPKLRDNWQITFAIPDADTIPLVASAKTLKESKQKIDDILDPNSVKFIRRLK